MLKLKEKNKNEEQSFLFSLLRIILSTMNNKEKANNYISGEEITLIKEKIEIKDFKLSFESENGNFVLDLSNFFIDQRLDQTLSDSQITSLMALLKQNKENDIIFKNYATLYIHYPCQA